MAHKSSSKLASSTLAETVAAALDGLQIELPSWGFADTGTRFGKFHQPAARTTEEKFADAGQVHKVTGACPTVALHVLWDVPEGTKPSDIKKVAERYGVRPGSISPNVFQDQIYKHGSLSNEQESVRRRALEHILDSVRIAREIGSRDVTPWFADGSNFPGTANIRARKRWMAEGLKRAHDALGPEQRLLVDHDLGRVSDRPNDLLHGNPLSPEGHQYRHDDLRWQRPVVCRGVRVRQHLGVGVVRVRQRGPSGGLGIGPDDDVGARAGIVEADALLVMLAGEDPDLPVRVVLVLPVRPADEPRVGVDECVVGDVRVR